MCCPCEVLDNIIHVVSNWRPEINLLEMEPGYEKNRLQAFCCQNPNGTKLVKQYHLDVIHPPGAEPCKVVRRLEKNSKNEMVLGRIVMCLEEVFYAIDDWHQGQTHLGQERT